MSSVEIPGFSSLSDPTISRPTKLFWGSILTACLVMTVFHCTQTIKSYIDNPISSTIYVDHQFEAQLPQILITSTVAWNFSKLHRDGFDERLFPSLIQALLARELAPGVQVPSTDVDWPDRFKNMDKFDFFTEYGFGCKDTFLYCSFNFDNFSCCDKAVPYWSMLYGTSQVLKDLPKQRRINSRDGLHIIIRWDNQMYEEFRRFAVNPFFTSYRLDIADDFTYPAVDSTLLPLGMFTHVKITPKITRRIKGVKVRCVEDTSSYNPAEVYRDICPALVYNRICKCKTVGYLFKNSNQSICDPRIMGSCIEDNLKAVFEECDSPHVKPMDLCERKEYQTSISSAPLEPYSIAAKLGENASSINVNHYVVAFVQYNLIGDVIEEVRDSQTPDGFVALLGGELGLWLGCSIVSVIQLLIYLFHQIRTRCRKSKALK